MVEILRKSWYNITIVCFLRGKRVYLRSLEIQGFKSFPDKTVLQFDSDITAIVGPNGSGKSNISDAISWVMGEQSSKALRGAKMEDVIFGGTLKRPAVGYAEATLVLDNQDGTLPVETPEVMITRRYYRSGESEYYINKQSARLRDINELLMDTGLGREGYSNIGQGRIDEILAQKSTDRREVFEEAAGISKYRHRKEETERRLANTQDNLLRIGDKISELELQVEPLRQQAEKAQKYLTLKGELQGLEVTVWLDSLDKVAESAKKAQEDYASAAFILEQAHDELNTLYHQAEQMALQLNQKSLELDLLRENITSLQTERQKKEADVSVLQAQVEHLQQNIERARHEMDEQSARSGSIAETMEERQQAIAALDEACAQLDAQVQEKTAQASEVQRELGAAQQALLQRAAQENLLLADAQDRKTQIASLTASMEEVEARKKTLQEDLQANETRRVQTEQQRAQCVKALQDAADGVQSAKNRIAGYALRLKTRQEKTQTLQRNLDGVSVQLRTLEAKANMLREMERDFEGFSKAVRLVMQEAARGALSGVHGPVSKLIRVEDRYTTAVETALGAAMQNIIVDDEASGKAAIQLLKRRDAGRATFLPLSTVTGRRLSEPSLANMPGYVGVASELAQTDGRYQGILENLLGRTVIAETLDNAIAMARKTGNRVRIVTLDGQVMNPGGSMTGGSSAKSAGVLSRANELKRLEQERGKLLDTQSDYKKSLQQAQSQLAETEYEIKTIGAELREAEDEVLRRTEEKKQVERLLETVSQAEDTCRRELERFLQRSGSDEGRLSLLSGQLEGVQAELAKITAQKQALQAQADEQANALSQVQESLAALRMTIAEKHAEKTAAEQTISQMQALREAMQGDRAQKQALIDSFRVQIETTEQDIAAQYAQIETLQKDADAKEQTLKTEVEARTAMEAKRNQTEKQAQEKNKDILLLERESARLEQKKATSELEQKQLIDKLWESYELTPSSAKEQTVEVESIAAANRRIGEVKRKMSSLGTPNLGAIDEYARVSERYEYLCSQRDDVLHAKGELETIVGDITREMTEIFVREFARINEYFGATFTEMFGGGKASLELEDEKEPLSCGIEIKVQPPGKQLKTITLLSGGEKAFVAIALYFAILKVRPTPFCMLDEIDAALDDRNVERFAAYLHKFSGKTQFIVITHRRGTMEAADVLYGVTMQEQGISKILHLDLDELQKQLGITA